MAPAGVRRYDSKPGVRCVSKERMRVIRIIHSLGLVSEARTVFRFLISLIPFIHCGSSYLAHASSSFSLVRLIAHRSFSPRLQTHLFHKSFSTTDRWFPSGLLHRLGLEPDFARADRFLPRAAYATRMHSAIYTVAACPSVCSSRSRVSSV